MLTQWHFLSLSEFEWWLRISYFFVLSFWGESFSYCREKGLSITFNYYLRNWPQNNFTKILVYFNDFHLLRHSRTYPFSNNPKVKVKEYWDFVQKLSHRFFIITLSMNVSVFFYYYTKKIILRLFPRICIFVPVICFRELGTCKDGFYLTRVLVACTC